MVLAVVDPGVGTERRGVAVEVGDGESYLVGPDNGLLASAVAMCGGATAAVALTNPDYQLPAPGPTFAGRDVFAPAAAHLCDGVPLAELGPAVDPVSLLPGLLPLSRDDDGELVAEVLWVDRYGNCQLNVDPDEIERLRRPGALRWGDDVRTDRAVRHLRRARPRRDRPRGRQLRDALGVHGPPLGRRRAGDAPSAPRWPSSSPVPTRRPPPSPPQPVNLTPRSPE